jgi:RES domain-containing protein
VAASKAVHRRKPSAQAKVPAPPEVFFRFEGMHRLIPSRFSRPTAGGATGSVLSAIADSEEMLDDITLLDGASNGRIRAERRGGIGISTYELVYGIPNAHIVNAAFCYTATGGGRFNSSTRGAWYAAEELDTSISEVTYHRARHLAEIVVPELPGEVPDTDESSYNDWLADFRTTFHQLAPAEVYADCLQGEPLPECYIPGQRLAAGLLSSGSNGLLYPSVRRPGHACLACFRPALVYNPHRGARLDIKLTREGTSYSVSTSLRS